jgi:hypothetical protein
VRAHCGDIFGRRLPGRTEENSICESAGFDHPVADTVSHSNADSCPNADANTHTWSVTLAIADPVWAAR